MYWIFFVLFILAALVPEVVRVGLFGLDEEGAETLLVFLLGAVGFSLFFVKEKALVRQVRERLRLQREKSDITKDLSESYSYIGETNRKIDLLRGLVLSLPESIGHFRLKETRKAYRSFERSVLMSCKTDAFLVRIVDTERGVVEKEIRNGRVSSCASVLLEKLVSSGKKVFEEGGCIIVRSPRSIGSHVSFLIYPKPMNRIEDHGILEALATQGLVLYFLERSVVELSRESVTVTRKKG
ncbi:MAG: hypothetical protein HGB34_03690 [Candidatus Moranbacteria bacterium]|nr:hypothetical protein [Candidatus Moranbacteria bacterium]NTW75977.1 hypothetical protein [Candidatus Moranbacteria bacterium]